MFFGMLGLNGAGV